MRRTSNLHSTYTPLTSSPATALPSLIAALCGASSVTITDHPSSPALVAGAIEQNVRDNLYTPPSDTDPDSASIPTPTPRTQTDVAVYGYTWGTSTFYQTNSYGIPAPAPGPSSLAPDTPLTAHCYPCPHRIIVADCLWMPSQHANIIRTIVDFLPEHAADPPSPAAAATADGNTSTPCALVIAGFHTGRGIVRDFFAQAVGRNISDGDDVVDPKDAAGDGEGEGEGDGRLTLAQIFETDMEGRRRAWTWERTREGETKWEAKRWCVVGLLVRR